MNLSSDAPRIWYNFKLSSPNDVSNRRGHYSQDRAVLAELVGKMMGDQAFRIKDLSW